MVNIFNAALYIQCFNCFTYIYVINIFVTKNNISVNMSPKTKTKYNKLLNDIVISRRYYYYTYNENTLLGILSTSFDLHIDTINYSVELYTI